jgi:hypothetical protein
MEMVEISSSSSSSFASSPAAEEAGEPMPLPRLVADIINVSASGRELREYEYPSESLIFVKRMVWLFLSFS